MSTHPCQRRVLRRVVRFHQHECPVPGAFDGIAQTIRRVTNEGRVPTRLDQDPQRRTGPTQSGGVPRTPPSLVATGPCPLHLVEEPVGLPFLLLFQRSKHRADALPGQGIGRTLDNNTREAITEAFPQPCLQQPDRIRARELLDRRAIAERARRDGVLQTASVGFDKQQPRAVSIRADAPGIRKP